MEDHRPDDDDSIADDAVLLVRIPNARPDSLKPLADGGHRPTSGGLKGKRYRDEAKSCDLGEHSTPKETQNRGPNGNFHVAEITAGKVRSLGLRIRRDPVINGPTQNQAHALIYGTRTDAEGDLRGALTDGEYGRLARVAQIILYAPDFA